MRNDNLIVLSKTLDKVNWKTMRIVRDAEEIRNMTQQPGKDMYAVGGATLVSSLMNLVPFQLVQGQYRRVQANSVEEFAKSVL